MRRVEEENKREEEHAYSVVSYWDTRISLSLSIDGSTTAFRPLNRRGPCDGSDTGFGRSTLSPPLSLSINLQLPSDLWTDQALFRWIWSGLRKKVTMLFDAFQDLTVARKVRGSPATLSDSFFLCLFFFFSAFGFAVGKSTDGRMRSRLPHSNSVY